MFLFFLGTSLNVRQSVDGAAQNHAPTQDVRPCAADVSEPDNSSPPAWTSAKHFKFEQCQDLLAHLYVQ